MSSSPLMALGLSRLGAYALALVLLTGSVVLPTAGAQTTYRASASVVQANRLFQQGNYKSAEASFEKALKRNPGNVKARSGLALVQAELYKLNAAEKNAEQVLQKDPKNAQAHIALGKVYWYRTSSSDMTYRREQDALLQKSEQAFRAAIQAAPRMPEAHNNLGRVLQAQGRQQEALAAYDKALDLDSNYEQALVYRGSLALETGNAQQAIEHFNRAIKANSKSSKGHFYKGAALAEMGQYHDALESLNTALYLEPNAAHILTKQGEIYQAQGNQAGAVGSYRKAILSKPEFAPAILNLSNLLQSRGDGELAVSELRNALNIKPGYVPYLVQAGDISLNVDKVDQAVDYYNQALAQEPSNPEALRGMASAQLRSAEKVASRGELTTSQDLLKAEEMVQNALQYDPNNIDLNLALIKLRKATGTPYDLQALEQAAAQPANDDVSRVNQGQALLALGRFNEADTVFSQLTQQYSGQTDKLFTLADTLAANGDTVGARRAYDTILAQDPGNVGAIRGKNRLDRIEERAESTLNQARSNNHWYSKKDRMSAKAFYLETLELNPRLSDARLELGNLYAREDAYDKAIFEYRSYLQLNPTMPEDERAKIERKIQSLEKKLADQQQSA